MSHQEGASVWHTLLAWPSRLLAVAGATLIGWIWSAAPGGIQLGWALQYTLLTAVAVVTSFWFWILLVNVATAALWVVLSWRTPTAPPSSGDWGFLDVVTWVNRQIGHIESLAAWIAVAFVLSPCLTGQAGLLAAVVLLGGPIINGLATSRFFGGEEARESRGALLMERRSTIYLSSLVGLAILALQAPNQLGAIFPLLLTVIPGLSLRYLRFRRRKFLERTGGDSTPMQVRENRLKRAELQVRAAAKGDIWVMAALVGGFFALIAGVSLWQRHHMEARNGTDLDGPSKPTDACRAEPGGPVTPTLALFVLADTQLHELGRKRFPGQMEVADTLVPVARRPVELDMLSTATVLRLQSVFARLAAERKAAGLSPPLWTHLGDLADLSCTGEIQRMIDLLGDYGCPPGAGGQEGGCHGAEAKQLAGVAPGNHDMSFQGNFGWSPYWDQACGAGRRLDKVGDDAALSALYLDRLAPAAVSRRRAGWAPARFFGSTPTSRFTVTPLGVVPLPAGSPRLARGVVAIFYDTTDRLVRDFGIAGAFGTVSADQTGAILATVEEMKNGRPADDPFADPWYVLLGHHPYDELTGSSREHVQALVAALDGAGARCGQVANEDCDRPRVLALVAAHTHRAGSHRHCIGQRVMREIVVGSVIDPPQQGAVIEVGLDAHGRGALRLSTLPTIARPGFVCAANQAIDAGACRRAMGDLAAAPACQDLVRGADADGTSGNSCDFLQRPLSLDAQIEGIVRHGGPVDPRALKAIDDKRARALLRCVCRDVPVGQEPEGCGDLAHPLKDEHYFPIIKRLAEDPAHQDELACLSWAASSLQAHKATGMTIADALRCAFDDPTLAPAQVTVVAAEEQACR